MRALSERATRMIVMMWPAQVGKTTILNHFLAKRIDLEPGPILVIKPTLDIAEAWSKDRLAPLLRDTPVLKGRVHDARARDSNNTLLHKVFPGGHVTIAGANAPAGLAERPIRDVLCDEVDRFPASAGTEGDPILLAFRRSATFRNGKRILCSSPTWKGRSRIAKEYALSTQEKWWVPCPHCSALQILLWGGTDMKFGLKWEPNRPETTYYECEHCHAAIREAHKGWMNAHGSWMADNPDAGLAVRGFWTNALISPWESWAELVTTWLRIKLDPDQLRPFVNTVLCEEWEDEGIVLEKTFLEERKGLGYPQDQALVPAGVGILTRAVDVQGDRLETTVQGWGAGYPCEGWLIEHELIPGDPGTAGPWEELAAMMRRQYRHELGADLIPQVTVVDSGGHHTSQVYAFTRPRIGQRVYAIKGSSLEGAPLLSRPTKSNSAKAILYMVGVFTAKESIVSRFTKISEPGPGYLHLPEWLDDEQLDQFSNEKLVRKIVGGRPRRTWVLTGGKRNEQFDLLVYNWAALHILGLPVVRNLDRYVAEVAVAGEKATAERAAVDPDAPPETPVVRSEAPPSWINRWRGG